MREMNQLAARPEKNLAIYFFSHEFILTVIYQKPLAKLSARTFANGF
jgi:hypothetical protein